MTTKIAFCMRDMQLGGVESVLIRTLDELQRHKDIDISIITYAKIKNAIYQKYFEKHPNIKCYSLYPCSWLGTKLPHFVVWRIFIHLLRDVYRNVKRFFVLRQFKDIDVFIDYHDFGFHDELKHINGAKKIAWFHSSINTFVSRGFIKYLKYYDKLVVLTDEFKTEFMKKYPKEKKKLVRIYNPIDIDDIKNKANEKIRKIPGDYFCCVARLTPDKDIETLLRGFDLFWKSNAKPKVKLVIVGDGNKKSEYQSFANKLESGRQIIFIGAQKNPFVYMKNAMANVLSSYSEGFGLVLIESAVVGTLNISSKCKCGPNEILLNGRGGLLFEPGNAKELAWYMSDVYNDQVDVKKMIIESTNALKRFDMNIIIEQIISLIA